MSVPRFGLKSYALYGKHCFYFYKHLNRKYLNSNLRVIYRTYHKINKWTQTLFIPLTQSNCYHRPGKMLLLDVANCYFCQIGFLTLQTSSPYECISFSVSSVFNI